MHPTPHFEPLTVRKLDPTWCEANPVASTPQPTASRNRHLALEIPLAISSRDHDPASSSAGGVHAAEPEDCDQPVAGLQRICVLLAEGFLAQKLAESRLHEFPQAIVRATPKSRESNNTSAGDNLIIEEVARCGSASPRHLGLALRINRTPLQKALRRLEAAGALVGVGKTRNRVYRVARSVETAAA